MTTHRILATVLISALLVTICVIFYMNTIGEVGAFTPLAFDRQIHIGQRASAAEEILGPPTQKIHNANLMEVGIYDVGERWLYLFNASGDITASAYLLFIYEDHVVGKSIELF